MKTKVDVGHGFLLQAKIPSTEKVIVKAAEGYLIEMDKPGAISFCAKKVELLEEKKARIMKKRATTKAHSLYMGFVTSR